ncbi:uncharacterized protein LOC134836754 [Culicoides brevitarsis]|uniref:uncharacterized protein LOC134836754 n=1 Tax=Culicoides brevitarsis TaxID=469753 RepID=UPI00307BF166
MSDILSPIFPKKRKLHHVDSIKIPFDLMSLDDDCLLHLLAYFTALELIHLRGLCSRLDRLILRHRRNYVTFNFSSIPISELTSVRVHEILEFLGPVVKSLTINICCLNLEYFMGIEGRVKKFAELYSCIAQNCVKLESLTLEFLDLNSRTVKNLSLVVKKLKSFTLRQCQFGESFVSCFDDVKNLEELSILKNFSITYEFLTKVSNLKTLCIEDCKNSVFDEFDFTKVFKNNSTLKKLEIQNCKWLNDSLMNFITENVTEIQDLSISGFTDVKIHRISALQHLKRLKIDATNDKGVKSTDVESLLNGLNEENLEDFHFTTDNLCFKIDLVAKFVNLRQLSLIRCNKITDIQMKKLQKLTSLEVLSLEGTAFSQNSLLGLIDSLPRLYLLWMTNDKMSPKLNLEFFEELICLLKKTQDRSMEFAATYKMGQNREISQNILDLLEKNRKCLKFVVLVRVPCGSGMCH